LEDRRISAVVPSSSTGRRLKILVHFLLIIDRKTFILGVLLSLVVFTFSLLKTSGDSALFRSDRSAVQYCNYSQYYFLLLLVYKEEKRSADSLLQHFSINRPCGSSFLSTPKSLFNRENKIGRGVSFIERTHIGSMPPSVVEVVWFGYIFLLFRGGRTGGHLFASFSR
jgi:hypothetical protein